VYVTHELVYKAVRICLCCVVALVLLVQRLNSDNLGAFCLDSLAGKVLKQSLLATSIGRRPT